MGALNLPQIASGQLQPYQTSNDADAALESAVADGLEVDLTGGDHTLSEAEFTRNVFFRTTGNSVSRSLITPDNAHLFVVYNGGSDALEVMSSTVGYSVNPGDVAVFYTDGTAGGIYVVSASSGSAAPRFSNSVSATPGATQNNYAPAGWNAATTNRLLATANAGGTTITGFDATGVSDGWAVYLYNPSTTDSITITNADTNSSAANRVNTPGGATAGGFVLVPQGSCFLVRVGAVWTIR